MNIINLILLITLIWLALRLTLRLAGIFATVRSLFNLGNRASHQQDTKATPNGQQKMVKCAYCQTYISEQDAYAHQGKFYCSKDHAKAT